MNRRCPNGAIRLWLCTVTHACEYGREPCLLYTSVGAMYQTATKTDADLTTMETLKEIKKRVHIPVVAIGGINGRTIPDLDVYKRQIVNCL